MISHVDKSDVWQFNMLNAGLVLSLSYLLYLWPGVELGFIGLTLTPGLVDIICD